MHLNAIVTTHDYIDIMLIIEIKMIKYNLKCNKGHEFVG